ncbi:MAG TPA: acyltransferase [Acidimicrobiales bacterium]
MALRRYIPQFDGVRAVAISAVVAYHLGHLRGGWVGVDIFFVLSGYLITSLLLDQERPPGSLAGFWGRRARRLLPAVLVLLAALSLYAWAGGAGLVPAQLRAPALATLFYVANWQQIAAGHSYFARYLSVGPLQQTWSLAIEEQYYLVWPLLILAITAATRGRRRGVLLGCTLALGVASAVWMGVAAHWLGPNRAYLGTDTRAWELLMGGAAAMVWPPVAGDGSERHRWWSALAVVGVLGVVIGAATAGGPPAWIWDGGLVAIAACATLVVVGALRAPRGVVAVVLALGPVRWVGLISYSLYLWHWPVIVLMTPDSIGRSGGPLLAARLGSMVALSCASYYLVERPLRRADWAGWHRRLHVPAVGFAVVGILATAAVVVVGTVGPPEATTAAVGRPAAPTASTQPLVRPDLPPASPAHPVRAWIFGDSVMVDSSLGITAALQATGEVTVVANQALAGWGLSTDPTWPAAVAQTQSEDHPQLAIGTWSWDEQLAGADPVGYQDELEHFIAALVAPPNGVALVALVQFPQQGPADALTDAGAREQNWIMQTELTDDWDRAARLAVAAFPGRAVYLTTQQLFAPGGRFLTWMRTPAGTWVRARKLDNTHMCPYGAAQFGALVTSELTPLLGLGPLQPGWEFGPWTRDPRYDDPPGACPDDQPPPGYRGLPVPMPPVPARTDQAARPSTATRTPAS